MKTIFNLLTALFLFTIPAMANNVQISNISIINGGPGLIQVQFDLSWDNSWRTNVGPANYDGVWVFFKYKDANGDWKQISQTGLNNVVPTGFDVYQTNEVNKVGAMFYREATNMGVGTSTFTTARLGVANSLPYNIDIRGFAVEMVYIPAGTTRPFFGDGNGTNESTNALHYINNTATTSGVLPMFTDANGFDDGELETDGIYVYSNDTIQTTNPLGSLEAFPTMKSLWCMKYELSQAGYRDFLNTLDSLQQVSRTNYPPTSAAGTFAMSSGGAGRNYIKVSTPATASNAAVYGCDANGNLIYNEAADGEWIACNFISWQDMAAYMDWSGLAPMSELQFERICRGISSAGANPPIYGEYAWGTTTLFGSLYTLSGTSTASEVPTNASTAVGNAAYASTYTNGPLRNGLFATGSSSRITSGASFYGVMEMTGNLTEYCIHLGSVAGRSCRYVPNGNGAISAAGNAQLSVGGAGFWPGMEGNSSLGTANTCSGTCEVSGTNTGCAGIRLRGGSILDAAASLAMADRSSNFIPTSRSHNRGGRAVLYIR